MIITLPRANGEFAGLGTVTRLRNGMPLEGLEGLWLFDGLEADGAAVSTLTDKSGKGRHGTLKSGWTAPVKRSYGVDVAGPHGSVFDVPLNANGRPLTVIVAWRPRIPGSESGVYLGLVTSTINNLPADPANSHPASPWTPFQYLGIGASGLYQMMDLGADVFGQNQVRATTSRQYGQPSIASMTLDGANNFARVAELGFAPASITNSLIGSYYNGTSRGTLQIGIHNYVGNRSAANPLAELYGFAAYSKAMTDAEVQTHMGFMNRIVAQRGISV